MNEITIINSTNVLDRTINVYGSFDNPLFLAKDVAEWIEHSNTSVMLQTVDDSEKGINIVYTPGGNQEVWMLTEDGLYEVLMQSRKPIAKEFKSKVKQYLKELRTKGFTATQPKLEEILLNPDLVIGLAMELKKERQAKENALREAEQKAKELKAAEPKVLFADSVVASNDTVLIGELARILKQNGVEIGQNRLFEWMRKKGYLCSKGNLYNQPTQSAMDMGLFEIKKTTINRPDSDPLIQTTTKVTGKGQIYFVNKFLYNKNKPS